MWKIKKVNEISRRYQPQMATIKPTIAKIHPATPRGDKDKEPAPLLDGALVGPPVDFVVEPDAVAR